MRKHLIHLSVALLTFVVGVTAAGLWLNCPRRLPADPPVRKTEVLTTASAPALFGPTGCNWETPEEKAVRLAEEFVARNGYTDLPPDREHISYESIERESNLDEMLKLRHDSLERKAYGIRYNGRMERDGWTVVFWPTLYRCGNALLAAKGTGLWGRAVTMDENFENLRVEHKSFPLANVQKKF